MVKSCRGSEPNGRARNMRALYWDGGDLKFRENHPEPKTTGGEAIVRVRLAGICSTDLQIFQGYMGFRGVPGHEFVGEVVKGAPALAGKRVVGEINFGCGFCESCRRGLARHCAKRRVMGILNADGCFAELLAIPARNLHPVPENISDEEARSEEHMSELQSHSFISYA